jgi:hypothetical protein
MHEGNIHMCCACDGLKELLSVAAMCVCNPDRLPLGINRRDTAQAPTGFAEIVCDDLSVLHCERC